MIKTGQSIKDTVGVLNQELPTKVNKSTTIAGIPLTSSISKYSLMRKLFVVQEETYASTPQEQQDFF